MGFRFFKRVKLAKGLYMNITPSGPSFSIGKTGSRLTFGSKGYRTTFGIPGSGVYYTTYQPYKSSTGTSSSPAKPKVSNIKPNKEEQLLIDGCTYLINNNLVQAFEALNKVAYYPDASFLLGFMCIQQNRLYEAETYLINALQNSQSFGLLERKFGIKAVMTLPITDEIVAQLLPSQSSALLALVEIYQFQERWKEVVDCLQQLISMAPNDLIVRLSYVEILIQVWPNDKQANDNVLKLTYGISNESAIHAALLLYRAYALKNLGMYDAALELLNTIIRRTKDRPAELLQAIRYERATLFERRGELARARKEYELIYNENPNFEDVAQKLGF